MNYSKQSEIKQKNRGSNEISKESGEDIFEGSNEKSSENLNWS
jgi:hypothetical protein